ncbi:MAG: hypothetical protein M1830_008318 [Pleopsidium flavum]|nr:MAG: hypothetical protein M1830_008318 [Pleopsidium flavum]
MPSKTYASSSGSSRDSSREGDYYMPREPRDTSYQSSSKSSSKKEKAVVINGGGPIYEEPRRKDHDSAKWR